MHELGNNNLKLMWWYIAAVNDSDIVEKGAQALGDDKFKPHFLSYDTAIAALTFEQDRAILRRAVELVTASYH